MKAGVPGHVRSHSARQGVFEGRQRTHTDPHEIHGGALDPRRRDEQKVRTTRAVPASQLRHALPTEIPSEVTLKSAPCTNALDGSDRTHRSDRCSKRGAGSLFFGRTVGAADGKCTAADDTTSRRLARACRPRENEESRRMAMTSELFDWTLRCSTRGRAAAIPSDSYAGEVPVGGSNEVNQAALSFKSRSRPAQTMRWIHRKGTTTHGGQIAPASAQREVAPIETA